VKGAAMLRLGPIRDLLRIALSQNRTFGITNSISQNIPIDHLNNPTPWFTYSAIHFLNSMDLHKKRVFEYGSGFSTLYFRNRGADVTSVEDNHFWKDKIDGTSPGAAKTEILYKEGPDYVNAPLTFAHTFDLIVVDGSFREECVNVAIRALSNNGMIILDNSDGYVNAAALLRKSGFLQIPFLGPGPMSAVLWETSLFVKAEKWKNFPIE
jgi:hypothetical protein